MRRFDQVTLAVPEQLGPGSLRCQVVQVVQASPTTGWARGWRFGRDEEDDEPVVFETHDAGRTWAELPPLCPPTGRVTRVAILALLAAGSAPQLLGPLASLLPGLHPPSPADPWLAWGLACLAVILALVLTVAVRRRRALGVWPVDVERLLAHPAPGHVVAVVQVQARRGVDLHELLWDGWRWRYLRPHDARRVVTFDDGS